MNGAVQILSAVVLTGRGTGHVYGQAHPVSLAHPDNGRRKLAATTGRARAGSLPRRQLHSGCAIRGSTSEEPAAGDLWVDRTSLAGRRHSCLPAVVVAAQRPGRRPLLKQRYGVRVT
jgi:hypothetical protein